MGMGELRPRVFGLTGRHFDKAQDKAGASCQMFAAGFHTLIVTRSQSKLYQIVLECFMYNSFRLLILP